MTISGLKFPIQIVNGRFAVVTEEDKLEQNIRRIVSTTIIKDRWYEPNMGSVGYNAIFRNASTSTMNSMASDMRVAINEQETRVVATVKPNFTESIDGLLIFDITYQRRDKLDIGVRGFSTFRMEL